MSYYNKGMIIFFLEPVPSKMYKLVCTPIEYTDQPAHPHSLIRVFAGYSIGSQVSNISSGVKLRYWSDCVDAQTVWSRNMRFPTMWYVRLAKALISLRIRAFWSEPLQVALIFYDCQATDRAAFGVSKLIRRLHMILSLFMSKCQIVGNHMSRLIWIFALCTNSLTFRLM